MSTIVSPQSEVAITVAADALTPSPSGLMTLKGFNIVSAGREIQKKVSTMVSHTINMISFMSF